MRRTFYFTLIVTGLILLALGGWAVRGLQYAAKAAFPRPLPRPQATTVNLVNGC